MTQSKDNRGPKGTGTKVNTFKVFRVRPSAWSACGCVMEVRDASASCFCSSGSLALLLTVPMMATRCVPDVHLKLVIVVL